VLKIAENDDDATHTESSVINVIAHIYSLCLYYVHGLTIIRKPIYLTTEFMLFMDLSVHQQDNSKCY